MCRAVRPMTFVALAFVLAMLAPVPSRAVDRTWQNGAASGNWDNDANWGGTRPSAGDDLKFTSAAGAATNPNNNDFAAGTSFNSLQFVNNTFNAALALGGNSIALTGGITFNSGSGAVIVNNNTTSGRNVTIDNDISLNSTVQFATADSANAITIVSGNITGSGEIQLRGRRLSVGVVNGLSSLRLSGDNSGYTGVISLRRSTDNGLFEGSVYFMSPSSWFSGGTWAASGSTAVRGVVQLAAGTYIFGIGTDAGEWNGLTGGNRNGLLAVGGTLVWDPGNGSGYSWDAQVGEVSFSALIPGGGETYFGTLGQALTLTGGNKALHPDGGITRVRYTLGDDGTARNLTVGSTASATSGGVLILEGADFSGHKGGTTTIGAGILSISGVNQIADGNLNMGQGVLVLNNVNWASFAADRAYGTGANQWQITGALTENVGGGFAARGQAVTISGGGTADFNRDFYLGSIITELDGLNLYANKGVTIAQDTVLSANRAWGMAGSQVVVSEIPPDVNGSNWQNFNTDNLAIHEISGSITGDYDLTLRGRNSRIPGIVRLSNAGNTFNNLNVAMTTAGRVVVIATSSAALGDGAVTLYNTGNSKGAGLLLFDNAGTVSRNVTFSTTSNTGGDPGIGSWAGNEVYTGTMTLSGSQNLPQHEFFAQSGSTFQLGDATTAANLTYSRGGASITYVKGGSGTVILSNLTYTTPPATVAWQLGAGVQNNVNNTPTVPYFDGAVRETGTGSADSLSGYFFTLAGGVLETSGSFTRTLSSTVNSANFAWGKGGGGFAAHGGALTVNWSGAATWNTAPFVMSSNPLILGSETANNVVTVQNNISLVNNGGQREIRVYDNANSTADKAAISGVLSGTGTAGVQKTGAGVLELSGDNTYAGATTVSAGTLLVSGSLNTQVSAVTINAGGTLGGSGTINRPVTVAAGGGIAPGDLAVGTLTVVGNVSVDAGATNAFELGASSDLLAVTGDLTLNDCVVNVSDAGGLTGGTHTIMTYTGTRTGSITIGSKPSGTTVTVDVSEANKVKLVVTMGPQGTTFVIR